MLYKADILAICPNAKPEIVDAIVAGGYKGLWERFGVTSPIAQAKFMGQVSVETGGLTRLVENLSYSAKRLCQVWPRRFKSLAEAQPYAGNPEALANKVYGGRMGNTKSGDGWRYIGRGLKQLTGFDNYKAEGEALGLDLIGNPDQVAKPDIAFLTALSYWKRNVKAAETASVETITVAVNGGVNGLADREIATERALEILVPGRMKKRQLERGCKGLDVALLQAQLVELGEKIAIDGVFGEGTEKAVIGFQSGNGGLLTHGIYNHVMRLELQLALQAERFKADPTIGSETQAETQQPEQSEQAKPLPDLPIDAVMTLAANIVTVQHGDVMGMNSVSLSSEDVAKIAKIKRMATVLWGQIKDLGDSRETAVALQELETAIMWATKSVVRQSSNNGA